MVTKTIEKEERYCDECGIRISSQRYYESSDPEVICKICGIDLCYKCGKNTPMGRVCSKCYQNHINALKEMEECDNERDRKVGEIHNQYDEKYRAIRSQIRQWQKLNSKFRTGSGVYVCRDCGKKTRETGEGESEVRLCADCYWYAGVENEINDGHYRCGCGETHDFTVNKKNRTISCNKCGRVPEVVD